VHDPGDRHPPVDLLTVLGPQRLEHRWAHIRRYFIRAGDAHTHLRVWADLWVERIAVLYLAHRDLAAATPGTDPHAKAGRAFDRALADIDAARTEQGALQGLHPAAAKVLATLDREWDGLVRHRDFPDIALDNNSAERALRTPVVGRKNYYGAQAEWAAHLAARVWTITCTAERNHQEPLAVLTAYLDACAQAGGRPPEGIALEKFLPWLPAPGTAGSHDHDPGDAIPPDQSVRDRPAP
jgi:transposase